MNDNEIVYVTITKDGRVIKSQPKPKPEYIWVK